jgi:hypothetical protein
MGACQVEKKALVEWDSGTSAVAGSVMVVYVKQSTADIYIFKSHIQYFVILMYIPLGLLKRIFSFSHWTINSQQVSVPKQDIHSSCDVNFFGEITCA